MGFQERPPRHQWQDLSPASRSLIVTFGHGALRGVRIDDEQVSDDLCDAFNFRPNGSLYMAALEHDRPTPREMLAVVLNLQLPAETEEQLKVVCALGGGDERVQLVTEVAVERVTQPNLLANLDRRFPGIDNVLTYMGERAALNIVE